MREIRIYTPEPLLVGTQVALGEGPSRHLLQVLRMGTGSSITLFNGDGHDYSAELQPQGKRAFALIQNSQPNLSESPLDIHLAQCISKGERMDYTLQKSTELGVQRIYPLYSARTEVKLKGDRATKKLQHWQAVVNSACEQCGRSRVPEVMPPRTLQDYLQNDFQQQIGLVFAPDASHGMHDLAPPDRPISLLIGPEGGLAAQEIALAQTHGFQSLRLGPRILRTETAPLCALSILQARFGDLN